MDPFLLSILLFGLGLFFLLRGGGALVDGASALARVWGVSEHLVGLTIVAIGTSLPELTVNLYSSSQGSPELAFGNVIGSNIANILLILGVTALILPLELQRSVIVSEIPFSILAVLLAGFLVNVPLLGGDFAGIGRVEGCVLLFFYFLFMLYVFGPARTEKHWVKNLKEGKEELLSVKGASLRVILGILALVIGGKWVVDGAVQLAEWMGMSKSFIGLTLVAVGTSLPELATSVTAALKKNSSIAVGNVVGSNIFNIFWILGLSGLIAPLPFEKEQNADISIALFSTTLLLLFLPFSRSKSLAWPAGLVLLLSYAAYLAYLIGRG